MADACFTRWNEIVNHLHESPPLDSNVAIAFIDFDDTIATATRYEGSARWFSDCERALRVGMTPPFSTLADLIAAHAALQVDVGLRPVEPSDVLRSALPKLAPRRFIITARAPESDAQIQGFLTDHNLAEYFDGVVYCARDNQSASQAKSEVIQEFLVGDTDENATFVFIDDTERHVRNVERAFGTRAIAVWFCSDQLPPPEAS